MCITIPRLRALHAVARSNRERLSGLEIERAIMAWYMRETEDKPFHVVTALFSDGGG